MNKIFVISRLITKFTKILGHENLELYGRSGMTYLTRSECYLASTPVAPDYSFVVDRLSVVVPALA